MKPLLRQLPVTNEVPLNSPSKLKFKKSFQPVEIDDDDELFQNGIFVFNITKLLAHIGANASEFPIENVLVGTLGITSSNLDDAAVLKADLGTPIILAEIAPGRFNIIDGNHRVERARREGAVTLPARRVGPDCHYRFLTSVDAYRRYVEYWNEKAAATAKRARVPP